LALDSFGIPAIILRAGTSDPAGMIREVGTVDEFVERHVAVIEEVGFCFLLWFLE